MPAMDAQYFREKAALCARLADGLSLNNPGRFQLMDLAEDFMKRAKELKRNGPRCLDVRQATSSTFKGIKVGQVLKSRRYSSEPHDLSAAWAKRSP